MIKNNFFIHIQTSSYYDTKLIDLHHAMLLNTILDQEAAATSKSKVLLKQSWFYITAFFYSKTLVNSDVVV